MRIEHHKSVRISGAEVIAYRIQQELMDKGYCTQSNIHHEDKASVAYDHHGRLIAVITWRELEWNASAHITVGGTLPDYRRKGVYRRLYSSLREHVRTHYPHLKSIDSGHHVDNEESRAMFTATGRAEPRFMLYEDRL